MRKLLKVLNVHWLATGLVTFAANYANALDTSVSNEFWCTWNYVNATPSVTSRVAVARFDSWSYTCNANVLGTSFTSRPYSGIVISFR